MFSIFFLNMVYHFNRDSEWYGKTLLWFTDPLFPHTTRIRRMGKALFSQAYVCAQWGSGVPGFLVLVSGPRCFLRGKERGAPGLFFSRGQRVLSRGSTLPWCWPGERVKGYSVLALAGGIPQSGLITGVPPSHFSQDQDRVPTPIPGQDRRRLHRWYASCIFMQ